MLVLWPVGATNFLYSKTSTSIRWHPPSCLPAVNQREREADHSPPSSVEVKRKWICTSILPQAFMAWIGTPLPLPLTHKIFLKQKQLNLISPKCILCSESEYSRMWRQWRVLSRCIHMKRAINMSLEGHFETLVNKLKLRTYGGRGDIFPRILHLSRRWNSVINFTLARERTSLLT
jgi:hypothetical protein